MRDEFFFFVYFVSSFMFCFLVCWREKFGGNLRERERERGALK